MKTYTKEEMEEIEFQGAYSSGGGVTFDKENQVILHTNIYKWKDGSFRSDPDPSRYDAASSSE